MNHLSKQDFERERRELEVKMADLAARAVASGIETDPRAPPRMETAYAIEAQTFGRAHRVLIAIEALIMGERPVDVRDCCRDRPGENTMSADRRLEKRG